MLKHRVLILRISNLVGMVDMKQSKRKKYTQLL